MGMDMDLKSEIREEIENSGWRGVVTLKMDDKYPDELVEEVHEEIEQQEKEQQKKQKEERIRELKPTERKIVNVVNTEDGVSNKRIAEEVDKKKSTVSHHISKLEEEGILKDTETANNRSNYVISDEVRVEKTRDFSALFTRRLKINLLESLFIPLFVVLSYGLDPQIILYVAILAFFLPDLVLNLVDTDKAFYDIQVTRV